MVTATIEDVLAGLIVKDVISLHSFSDEAQHVDRLDFCNNTSDEPVFAEITHVGVGQLIRHDKEHLIKMLS